MGGSACSSLRGEFCTLLSLGLLWREVGPAKQFLQGRTLYSLTMGGGGVGPDYCFQGICPLLFCIFFAGLQKTVIWPLFCLCRPFCFFLDVWTRTQSATVASRRPLLCHYFSESIRRSCNCSLRVVAIIHMTLRGPLLGSEHACLPASHIPPPPVIKGCFPVETLTCSDFISVKCRFPVKI